LWIGLLSERPAGTELPDNIAGPTLKCLIGEQFKKLKYGDRFYYENAPDAAKGTLNTAFTLGK